MDGLWLAGPMNDLFFFWKDKKKKQKSQCGVRVSPLQPCFLKKWQRFDFIRCCFKGSPITAPFEHSLSRTPVYESVWACVTFFILARLNMFRSTTAKQRGGDRRDTDDAPCADRDYFFLTGHWGHGESVVPPLCCYKLIAMYRIKTTL